MQTTIDQYLRQNYECQIEKWAAVVKEAADNLIVIRALTQTVPSFELDLVCDTIAKDAMTAARFTHCDMMLLGGERGTP